MSLPPLTFSQARALSHKIGGGTPRDNRGPLRLLAERIGRWLLAWGGHA